MKKYIKGIVIFVCIIAILVSVVSFTFMKYREKCVWDAATEQACLQYISDITNGVDPGETLYVVMKDEVTGKEYIYYFDVATIAQEYANVFLSEGESN